MPAETPPSGPAAMLAELKHTISLGPDAAANAAQRLHRVVEAVLKRADDWESEAREMREQSVRDGLHPALARGHREASLLVQRASDLRQAITRELLGEEESDG